jgi:hypothetical protein
VSRRQQRDQCEDDRDREDEQYAPADVAKAITDLGLDPDKPEPRRS